MKLSDGKSIILFRFHKNPEIAAERLRILNYFNPKIPRYVLFGGEPKFFDDAKAKVQKLAEHVWLYPEDKPRSWKWMHGDLMQKQWYRDYGHTVDFDFLFSYEYDLLALAPLKNLYPNIDDQSIALSAATKFTDEIERTWHWTTDKQLRRKFMKFSHYLEQNYGIQRQKYVSLGPGPLLPRKFMDKWEQTADIDLVHDELAYPAYAQALGFKIENNTLHPGFGSSKAQSQYFNCHDEPVPMDKIKEQLSIGKGIRAFHPVKYMVKIEDVGSWSNQLDLAS